jgi:hypothetical protein
VRVWNWRNKSKDGQFEIGLFKKGKNIYVTMKDKGKGVTLERFYRVDNGRKGGETAFQMGLTSSILPKNYE